MTDLRSRLSRLGYRDAAPPSPEEAPSREAQGEEPGRSARPGPSSFPSFARPRAAFPIEAVVPGYHLENALGRCFVGEQVHSTGHPHGSYRLEEALEVETDALAWLARGAWSQGLELSRFAFLDTETTGLAGGTGTYAFLVGIGHFDGSRFLVRQFFMEDYDGEEALLAGVEAALAPFSGVVTFNGRSFDVPLLETRFSLSRRRFPLREAPHLDLLYPARRLWRERLESCALSVLETEILGVERDWDVPGWAIPGIYFNYLQTGDARPLAPVFEHNRHDLLSLVCLAARLARQYVDPFHPELEHWQDLYALGAVFEGVGQAERAALCYERAMALAPSGDARGRVMVRLGALYKRLRLQEDALLLWRKLAVSSRTHTLVAHLELAKHYEHVEKDYLEAERVTLQAMATLELRAGRGEVWRLQEERRQLEHRLARLRRKMSR